MGWWLFTLQFRRFDRRLKGGDERRVGGGERWRIDRESVAQIIISEGQCEAEQLTAPF